MSRQPTGVKREVMWGMASSHIRTHRLVQNGRLHGLRDFSGQVFFIVGASLYSGSGGTGSVP